MTALWRSEWKPLLWIGGAFFAFYFLPLESARWSRSINEAVLLTQWYAREHVLLCLIPAFFIAGAIGVFISQAAVMKYLGADANRFVAFGVASVAGAILAVCSCTVLPLFAGIYRRGAGIGPASAFLYSGPAINVLAMILTARILGVELGIARSLGAIVFSILVGLLMAVIFCKDELARVQAAMVAPPGDSRPLWQTVLFMGAMIAALIFATWGKPDSEIGFYSAIFRIKWYLTGASAIVIGYLMIRMMKMAWWKIAIIGVAVAIASIAFSDRPLIVFVVGVLGLAVVTSLDHGEAGEWFAQTWGFAKQIMPLLLVGIMIAGLLLGRPGNEALIPSGWIADAVGGNSLWANLFASVAGAFMYFATLTEVPILQGLLGAGMGQGPALALLLAGPALSLPSMLVLNSIFGFKRTLVFVILVVVMATISGMMFGAISG